MAGHVFEQTAWMSAAACTGVDTEVFFPGRGESVAAAKAVCEGCGVRAECREYAMARNEVHGVWGGLSGQERKRLRRGRKARWWGTAEVAAHCEVTPTEVGVLVARGLLPAPDRRLTKPARQLWRPARILAHTLPERLRPAGEVA